MPSEQHFYRVGGFAAIIGVLVLVLSTFAHPMSASPADAPAAFAEYAADSWWIVSHLGQLLGVALFSGGLVALSWRLRAGRSGVWSLLAALGTVSSAVMSGALQAVDGIALKVMVDRWLMATAEEQALFFEGAFAVRQVEIGLASIVILFFGVTSLLYANALRISQAAPQWLAWLALLSGALMLVAGIIFAHSGFSDTGMMVSMPANLLLSVWGLAVGVYLLRQAGNTGATGSTHANH